MTSEPEAPSAATNLPAPAAAPRLSHILIVEDSVTQSLKLRYLLEKRGFEVTIARNGVEALSMMGSETPAVVISDISMPEMDGYELCQRIRTESRLAHVPVILLTALADPKDIVKGLQCGANNFIVKPYSENFLLSQIDYLIANQELRTASTQEAGIELFLAGQKHSFSVDRMQIIDLLISSYDTAIQKNRELLEATAKLEQKTAELERSNRELEQFGYVVSHDLQEPLRAIGGFLDLLRKRYEGELDDKAMQYIEYAVDGAKRMQALIRDLLTYARSGAASADLPSVSLEVVLRYALFNLKAVIEETHADLQYDPLPTVRGDVTQLTQLFQNLISNGLKFRREGVQPVIRIHLEEKPEVYQLTFRDNGIGI